MMKRTVSNLLELAALGALVVGAALISAAAAWIVGGLAGLAYVRGLTR